ncbi:MAG: Glu-tRNA(Gln) amidotransferase subunit GatE [Candidatus Zixiibacteriota bacterium]
MTYRLNPSDNYERTKQEVGYVPREQAKPETYAALGFKCGLEVHQQLLTKQKLFCRCPAGIFQKPDDYDAEIIRHMRPTLSELGEYDGTALMEFKTRKNIVYRIKDVTACTYDIDDTPPFPMNREALDIAIEIALMLKTNIVGELHVARKQYLDGSIPTGFQRTAIVGIEGTIPLKNKTVRIIQISIEEDSCREISDIGHWRVYRTDRLGMPLIETVTYPDMLTPDEAAEAAQYIRFLNRASGKVRVGIGAAREDVNVSITGGTRVEIKGVAHIRWIPELVHNEAYRQRSLLLIKAELAKRELDPKTWSISHKELDADFLPREQRAIKRVRARGWQLLGVNLPKFEGILSYFTQPDRMFADEISDRLKVIACLERPNMLHSEQLHLFGDEQELVDIRDFLDAEPGDAQIVLWGPPEDMKTALETIEERCKLAMTGVPNETRKSIADGTTIFERVLPGADRMYPDTDSAPISIDDNVIAEVKKALPVSVSDRLAQLREWKVPEDCFEYILRNNLIPLIEVITSECKQTPRFVATMFAHGLKNLQGRKKASVDFNFEKIRQLLLFVEQRNLGNEILKKMLPEVYEHPNMDFDSVLTTIDFREQRIDEILEFLPALRRKYLEIRKREDDEAKIRWVMGQMRKRAVGNVSLRELHGRITKEINHG